MNDKKSHVPQLRFPKFLNPWEATTLGKISTWSTGSGLQKDTLNYEGKGDRAIHYGSLFSFKEYIFKEDIVTYTDVNEGKFIPINSLLFARKDVTPYGLARTSAIDTPNVKAAEAVMIANLDKEVDATFVSYQLNKNKHYFIPYITGTSIKGITSADLKLLKVSLPSLIEQQKIANFFKALDNLIKMSKVLKENYSTLREYLVRQLIPSTRNPIPRLRFAPFDSPWDVITFEKIGSVKSCKRVLIEQTTPEGDIPFYKIGTFGGQADAYITRELFEAYKSKYPYPKKGDVMMSAIGTIGKCIVYNGEEAYYKDSNIIWLTNDRGVDGKFLQILLSVVNWGAEGSTLRKISSKDILNMLTVLPSKEEQIKVSNLITDVENHIKKLSSKISSLEMFKQTLLQIMFV